MSPDVHLLMKNRNLSKKRFRMLSIFQSTVLKTNADPFINRIASKSRIQHFKQIAHYLLHNCIYVNGLVLLTIKKKKKLFVENQKK